MLISSPSISCLLDVIFVTIDERRSVEDLQECYIECLDAAVAIKQRTIVKILNQKCQNVITMSFRRYHALQLVALVLFKCFIFKKSSTIFLPILAGFAREKACAIALGTVRSWLTIKTNRDNVQYGLVLYSHV